MSWKRIASDDPSSAKPIYSVDDSKKLLGYEGWRTLNNYDKSGPLLSSLSLFAGPSGARWTSPSMTAWCEYHKDCNENECKVESVESDYYKRQCHRGKPEINQACFCGIHSFSSLDELRKYREGDDPGSYWQSRFDDIPVRLVHSGKLIKGMTGIKSYQATLTGLYLPSLYTEEDAGFYNDPWSEEFPTIRARKAEARRRISTKIKMASEHYGLPILDADTPENHPTSEQFLKQRYGI